MDSQEKIKQQVETNNVVLYMKGTPDMPQCGFSQRAVQILRASGVESLLAVNVLDDMDIRQGIKVFSSWPTIPQLYIQGEFIGGSDIMMEMYQNGEMKKKIDEL